MLLELVAATVVACLSQGELVERLAAEYKEVPVWAGVAKNGLLLELFKSKDKKEKSWTLVTIYPDGQACIVAIGDDWEDIPMLQLPEKGERV